MAVRTFGIRKRRNEGRWLLASALMVTTALVMTPKAEAQQAGIIDLFEQTFRAFEVIGLSADGRHAALNTSIGQRQEALFWDGSTYRSIGGLGNTINSIAMDMSGMGDTIVGGSLNNDYYTRAFRWSLDTGIIDLGTLRADNSGFGFAYGVSHNGRHIVGEADGDLTRTGFIWRADSSGHSSGGTMVTLSGHSGSEVGAAAALAVSPTGNVAAGISRGNIYSTATYWDVSEPGDFYTGVELAGLGGNNSAAYGVGAWGHTIVGYAQNADNEDRAVAWRRQGGDYSVENLGVLEGGVASRALAISADGNVIGGYSADIDGRSFAVRWTDGEMVYVGDWLSTFGVDVGTIRLSDVKALSENGTVVAGTMYDDDGAPRAYIARSDGPGPGPGGGLMDVAEYHQTLYSAAGIANTGELLTWLPMNGAHHRPLMLTPSLSGDMCAWATGDFARHGASATGLALAEIGACTDLAGGNVRIGGAVGTSGSWQDLALGGSARMQGQYVLSEIDWQPDGTPLLLSLTGMLGSYKADIERAYSNGAATAISNGKTNAFGGVIRVRADWLEAAVVGNTSINPYASLGLGRLHVDGYTESGGPFPAVFNAQSLGHADIRLGVTAVTEFSATTKLSTTLEVAHRTGDAAAAVGNVPGLFNFSLGGGAYAQTWARVGAELDHRVNENLSLSASTHLATNGRDPSLAFSAGIKGAF